MLGPEQRIVGRLDPGWRHSGGNVYEHVESDDNLHVVHLVLCGRHVALPIDGSDYIPCSPIGQDGSFSICLIDQTLRRYFNSICSISLHIPHI